MTFPMVCALPFSRTNAHSGVGPFAAIYNLYVQGGGALTKNEPVPFWILVIGMKTL